MNSAADTRAAELDLLSRRVRADFDEMPDLHVTTGQAERLWALDHVTCDLVLSALVNAKFLRRTRQGGFIRAAATS